MRVISCFTVGLISHLTVVKVIRAHQKHSAKVQAATLSVPGVVLFWYRPVRTLLSSDSQIYIRLAKLRIATPDIIKFTSK